jgi:predicted transcriptional regulator
MNSPKEKAKELVDKYWIYLRAGLLYDEEAKDDAKHCAIIAAREMLEEIKEHKYDDSSAIRIIYWFKVINEIGKI